MLFLVAGLLGGMLLTPNRRFLRSIWFWAGTALALAIISPVVFWQFQHHFVGLDWMKSIHARDIGWGKTDYFLLNQFWKPPTQSRSLSGAPDYGFSSPHRKASRSVC